MTQITGFEDMKNLEAVKRVMDAWLVEGPVPFYHNSIKTQLYHKWPTLAHAVENLCRVYRAPILRYELHVIWIRSSIKIPITMEYNTWDKLLKANDQLCRNVYNNAPTMLPTIYEFSMKLTHTGRHENNKYHG